MTSRQKDLFKKHQSLIDRHKGEMKKSLSEYLQISEEGIEEIFSAIHFKCYEEGTVLVQSGEVSNDCCLILKGCVRQYHLQEGDEITTFFFTEDQWFASYYSAKNSKPVKYYLACVEDTVLAVMNIESEYELFKKYPEFESVCRTGIEEQLEKYQELLVAFMSFSPMQRYKNVLKNRPDLIQRVPQYQLASYLGITPESLSRIRKRISSSK
jgi:signal-transduction protein with cAMP-binding, CBS, and nucleotidyltransferase domain